MFDIPIGPSIPSPPQWLDFTSRQDDQGAKEFTHGELASTNQLARINNLINALGYRADVTDRWHAYDIGAADFNFDSLVSFDCDDATLTKRMMLVLEGIDIASLRPTLCKVPPAQYGKGWSDHMVLLALQEEGTVVLDNVIPWVYPLKDAPYQWIAMVGLTNQNWRLIGWRWARFKKEEGLT